MNSKAAHGLSKSSLGRIVGVVIPIAALAFLVYTQANFLVGRSLLIAFGDTESTYKGAGFEWDGDVVAKDLVIFPYELGEEAAIRFETVHVETPGWFWFVRNTFDRRLKHAKLDRVHLTLTGGTSAGGFEPSLGDLGPIGAASASPFEAEGCLTDNLWMHDELEQMGLNPEPTRLEFDYRVQGTELLTTIVLETKGSSRVQLDRKSELPTQINALLLDQYPSETVAERWEVQDQGFVSARNRFCSKKDSVEPRRFVDRHVESVGRLLEMGGLGVDSESRTAYRRFSRDGGKLTFGGDYAQALSSDEFYDLRASGDALGRMNARIDHNGRGNAVQWQRFDPRPLAGIETGEPTYVLLQRERASGVATQIDPAAAATLASPTAGVPAVATTDDPSAIPAAPPIAAPTDAPAGPPSSTAVVSATTASSTAEPATAGGTPAPATALTIAPEPGPDLEPTTTPEPVTDASSASASAPVADEPAATPTPAAAAPAAPTRAAQPAASINPRIKASSNPSVPTGPKTGTRLEWEDLPKYRGRLVRIWTVHKPPGTVEVVAADGNALRVIARLGGGNAEYTIQRDGFLRATLIR